MSTHPRRARLAIAAMMTIMVAGCTSSGGASATITPGSASVTAAGSAPVSQPVSEPVPPELQRFHDQELSWSGCVDFATEDFREDGYGFDRFECARLTVPLDYDNPSAEASTVTLGVMRSPARGPAERVGTLIAVPDASGLGMDLTAFSLGSGPGEHLNERFDVIGFDRRGVGASESLIACLPGPDLDRIRETPTRTRTDAEVSAANAEMAMFMPACVQNSAADADVDPRELLRHSGSAETVEDLDALRGVLGEDRVSLVAYSHGGRIAAAYAAEHPDRVRAPLLDSPFLAEDSSDFRLPNCRRSRPPSRGSRHGVRP